MKRIVVTAVGGDIGYAVVKALKASTHDLYIIGCDIKPYNMSCDVVDEFYVCPPYKNIDMWTKYMVDLIAKSNVDFFWPITEPEIKIVNQRKDLFASTMVIMNQSNVLEVAMDKGETARFLLRNGVLTPKTWTSKNENEIQYPVIVKEKFGCGSHSVALVNDYAQLEHAFDEMESPIVQEYIGDQSGEYTLTVFSDGKVINHIAFKRELGFGGMSRYVELIHDNELGEIAIRIAKMFELHGSINVQLRKDHGEYYVFEINPRISSTMGFRMLLGFNDAAWWMNMLENKAIETYVAPEGKIVGVRTIEEKIFRE